MPYIVTDRAGNKVPDHPEEGFSLLAEAALFARNSGIPGVTIRRDDV